jgi:nucleotide-binding universal stress UspA family protein
MYQNLLVGYDESPSSRAALDQAARWVKKHGGTVSLVHAIFFDTEEFGIAPEQLDKRVRLGKKICGLAKEKLDADFAVPVTSLICEGDPADVLLDTVRGNHADLVVLGTYGRRGLKRMLMGSVTAEVISRSPVDVLVVKRPCPDCTGAFRSILVPFDGSAFSARALTQACRLAKLDGARVTALYAIPRYEEMVDFFRSEGIRNSLAREGEKILAEAGRIATAEGVPLETEIVDGPAAERIVEQAAKGEADLIAMGSHGYRGVNRALLGSTAERVITSAGCPVLVVKEQS